MLLPFHSNSAIAISKKPEIVDSQVIFGTPSRNCSGSGICKVYTIHGARRLTISCEMVMARLAFWDTQLQMSFSIKACSEQLLQKQFGNGSFLMEEIFHLPSWLNRKWNNPAAFVPVGTYPIECRNDFIWLKFPLCLFGDER